MRVRAARPPPTPMLQRALSLHHIRYKSSPPFEFQRLTPNNQEEAAAPPSHDCVKFEHCVRARHLIQSGVVRTACERSHWLSEMTGCEIYLKAEHQQFTGSFKERGARNSLLSLTSSQRSRGVVAASAGNHALALSWHGTNLGIPVTVVMPNVAPMAKVDKCRRFGASVVIHGANIGEAKAFAQERFGGLRYINGYDDPEIIAGTVRMH